MGIFVRAVVSGFGFSLGAALFKKVAKQIGFDEETVKESKPDKVPVDQTDAGDDVAEGEIVE